MTDLTVVPVEKLLGDERTEFGIVDHTIHEADGVDVVFTNGNVHHWDYGDVLVIRPPR